jgi:hypothetical protein
MSFDLAILLTGIYPKEIIDKIVDDLGTRIFAINGNCRISV